MNKWRKPFSILTVIAVMLASGVTWLTSTAQAAGGQLYMTLGSSSVNPGGSITVNVRVAPTTPADTVNLVLNYDSSKVTYSSIAYAGSPFDQHFGFSSSGGKVTVAAAILGSNVSTDSAVAQVTFTASNVAGPAVFTLTGSDVAAGGDSIAPTLGANQSVSFTCPSGKTGTPPNCTTPSTPTTPTTPTTPSTPSKTTTPSKTSTGSSTGTSGGSSTGSTTTTTTKPVGTPATVTGQSIQYTKATITCTTKTASTAYIRYGIDGNLNSNTPVSASATTHNIALDSATLLPGMTYSYVIVTTDASGTVSQTSVQTFKTKGLQITLSLTDSNHKPLKGKTVTLHSDPQTGKTDDKGNVTFSDVAVGSHSVIYTNGKKTYTQQVSVLNNIQTAGETQSAPTQSFSVVYGFAQSSFNMMWLWIAIIVIVLGTIIVLWQTGRLGFAMQMRNHNYAAPLSAPVVVGSNSSSPHTVGSGSSMNDTERAKVQEHLNAIPNPKQPSPGSTVAPKDEGSDQGSNNGQFGGGE